MVRHALWSKRRVGSLMEVGVLIQPHKSPSPDGRALTAINWGGVATGRFRKRNILTIATD